MRGLTAVLLSLSAGCALGLGPFSPATTGQHASERTSRTNEAGEVAGPDKVWVMPTLADSAWGALLGLRFGPSLVSLSGLESQGAGLGGQLHLDVTRQNGDWGLGLALGYGSTNGSIKQGDVKYGGFSLTPIFIHSLGGGLSAHVGAGVESAGVTLYPQGASDGVGGDTTLGFRGQLGLTYSGSSQTNSFGLRLELSVQRSGALRVAATDTTATAWLLSLEPIYGAF
jgi:hypothetical protein